MQKSQSVINLDPIERQRKRQDSVISKLFKTRHFRGKPAQKTDPFGHYMFCGKQRHGKTTSALWYAEQLKKKYNKKHKSVVLFSNFGIGVPIEKFTISPTIRKIEYDPDFVYIFLIDEIQSYFPKDTKDTITLAEIDKLTADFSQLGKKQIYVLSTAQVYGRVNKNLREQCLYMVYCHLTFFTHKIASEFIDGDDILCDDLGRWSGVPQRIYVHGLPINQFDTHKMIVK